MNSAAMNIGGAIEAQSPAPVEPLSAASTNLGMGHLRAAFAAEGLPGAMVYSQNCYDALTREFSWAKLDTCGAFDLLAVRTADAGAPTGSSAEGVWFQSEAAAGRYLAAATGGGEEAANADIRLSELQARVARARPVVRATAPESEEDEEVPDNGAEEPSPDDAGNIFANSALTDQLE